jgi:quinol monooxygenase YgiN
MSMLTKVAFFTARPGQSDALGQRLLALVGPTRQEPGCVRYDIYQSSNSAEAGSFMRLALAHGF